MNNSDRITKTKVVPPEIKKAAETDFDFAIDRKNPFFKRVKAFFRGQNKLGRIAGNVLDIATVFIPYGRVVNSGRDLIRTIDNRKPKKMNWILNRLKEKSTWRGIVAAATALGVALSPEQTAAIITLGVALAGAFEVFFKEPQSDDAVR